MESKQQQEKVTWASVPRKGQLFILALSIFTETVIKASIVTYILFQLQSLDPSKPHGEVVKEAAFLQMVYSVAQCMSVTFLGRLADSPRAGRKFVLLMSGCGSLTSCGLFGFIGSFKQAVFLRAIEGATNGNTAMVRTMVSEVVQDKRYQPRAFVLLPIVQNMAAFSAPLIWSRAAEAGMAVREGGDTTAFLYKFPYALPALLNASLIACVLFSVFFFLEETQESLRGKHDRGIEISRRVLSKLFPSRFPPPSSQSVAYERVPLDSGDEEAMGLMEDAEDEDSQSSSTPAKAEEKAPPNFLPTRRMFTGNLVLVLCAAVLQEMHMTSTSVVTPYFLMEPVATEEQMRQRVLPFRFTGGAGFQPHSVAIFAAMAGVLTMPAHIFIYPRVVQRLGTLWTWRFALIPFFVLYSVIPYASVIPSTTPYPSEKTGFWIWAFITCFKVFGAFATFSVTSMLLLTTLASPHPSALARTHSLAFMLTEGTRAITAGTAGVVYVWGASHNIIGLLFWINSAICLPEIFASMFVKEGNGHAVRMEGDEDEEMKSPGKVEQVSKA